MRLRRWMKALALSLACAAPAIAEKTVPSTLNPSALPAPMLTPAGYTENAPVKNADGRTSPALVVPGSVVLTPIEGSDKKAAADEGGPAPVPAPMPAGPAAVHSAPAAPVAASTGTCACENGVSGWTSRQSGHGSMFTS